ncbi:MAG: GGDEF domain-containing protein [Rhizobium sp.]|nr:GGDEF domain-containing protein [Rhizobium sp.]
MDHILHLPTIMIVHALITCISTVVTIYMWLRARGSRILPLLVAAGIAACAAMLLHSARNTLPLFLSSGVGLGLGVLAVGFYWQAVVAFEGGKVSLVKASVGIVIWTALWLTPVFHQSMAARTIILGLLVAGYCFLTAFEILRKSKQEPLPSRSIAAFSNVIRGVVWLAPTPLSIFSAPAYAADGTTAPWFAFIVLANSMMIVLSLVALLMLAKERDEYRYRLASERDPLTNLANRRTFVASANQVLMQEQGGASLLLLDIDHFKTVNDTHGHAAGDQVLLAFSRVIEQRMPKGWLFARIGGEEFACLMPRMSAQKAVSVAENLRRAVAEMVIPVPSPLQVTVSIGVSEASARGVELDTLLASADAALYRAKADGRNCVRFCEPVILLEETAATLALAAGEQRRSVVRLRPRGE